MQSKGRLRSKVYARSRASSQSLQIIPWSPHFSGTQDGDRKEKGSFPEPQEVAFILETSSIQMPMVKRSSQEATILTQTMPRQGSGTQVQQHPKLGSQGTQCSGPLEFISSRRGEGSCHLLSNLLSQLWTELLKEALLAQFPGHLACGISPRLRILLPHRC